MQCFFESESFEDAIRNAISIGGDSDTLAAITGALAQGFYGIDDDMKETALSFLDDVLLNVVENFKKRY
jgi:type I restriction enzyme M protein